MVLAVVYFLQVLDKTVMGFTATVGLKKDANLVGEQYSIVSSVAPYAQIGTSRSHTLADGCSA